MKLLNKFASAKTIQTDLVKRQEAVIAEAQSILKEAEAAATDKHSERLLALGFTKSIEARQALERKKKASKVMEVVKANEDVALKYPGFRFVSKNVMNEVCKDYGLVIGGVERYTGKVPDWVPLAIERSGIIKMVDVFYEFYASGRVYIKRIIKTDEDRVQYQGMVKADPSCRRIVNGPNHELLIAAPKSMMLIGKDEKVEGYRIVKKDPIVMIEVTGGYVVLAAWDEEGRDPRIINTSNN